MARDSKSTDDITSASELAEQAAESAYGHNPLNDLRLRDLADAAGMLTRHAVRRPGALVRGYFTFLGELANVALGTSEREPRPGDKRFTDAAWKENVFYGALLKSYLALDAAFEDYADRAGLDAKDVGRAKFLLKQISDAVAPTNFLLGNPTALKRLIETNGSSIFDGFSNFVGDLSEGRPVPSQVDTRPFGVGKNLAISPGHVVMRTEMFELVQYSPRTPEVRQRPLLVIPSIINKYYVIDLAPGRSFVEYVVEHELTVFVMVWRNPKREHDSWGMEAYMDAMEAALDAVHDITGVEDPNVMSVCGAGPVTLSLAGYYAARGQRKIHSLMLMVSPLDTKSMAQAQGIGDFMDPEIDKLAKVAKRLPKSSRVSANEFTLLFAMLRPNDLIWNYWVNNYLLGNQPPAFDVLYWNSDATGMTAGFSRDFAEFSRENPLVEAGKAVVRGTPIADLATLDFDSYVIGAATDHICVWPAVYRSAQMLGERAQFVLSGSGHVQTIVCPPGNPKSHYFVNAEKPGTANEWLEGAAKVQGTWWDHVLGWWTERSGPLAPAPASAGSERHKPDGKAPGTYVLEQA